MNRNKKIHDLKYNKVPVTEITNKVPKWGYRHQQSFVLFLTLSVSFTMKSCMGLSLVAMTAVDDGLDTGNNTISAENATLGYFNPLMLAPSYPTFNWNKKIQDTIIASFFWGYFLVQIPVGQLIHRLGSKHMLMGTMLINCVVSILLPNITYSGGWICTAICRFIQGLSQACILPGLHSALGKWAPLHDRGRLSSFVYGGQAVGTAFGLQITGLISSSSMGWPGIFRVYGLMSGLSTILLWWLAVDSPSQHPKISDAERVYIEDDLGTVTDKKMAVPWLKILSTKGMYAIIISQIAHTWAHVTLFSEVPAYMDKILKVNIKTNGLLTALPFIVMWFTNFLFSWMIDMFIVKNIFSVTTTRKIANSLGFIPAAIGFIAITYVPQNIIAVEIVLITICAFKISASSGFLNSIYLWRPVFLMSAGLILVANTIYVVFGTGQKADWNEPPKQSLDICEDNKLLEKTI